MVYNCVLSFHSTLAGHYFCALVRQVVISGAEVSLNFPSHTGTSAALSTRRCCEFLSALCRLSGNVLYFPMCVFCTVGSNVSFIIKKINMLKHKHKTSCFASFFLTLAAKIQKRPRESPAASGNSGTAPPRPGPPDLLAPLPGRADRHLQRSQCERQTVLVTRGQLTRHE